jgi:hypothetical protein
MPEDVFSLFDDYAARFARGERPETRSYLARAGAGAGELAQLIDGYLARATPPPPSEDAVALTTASLRGRSPLVEARERRGLRREEVVDALIAALGLDRAKREKVGRYYEELETGLREARRVDRRVFDALGATLRASVSDLLAWRPLPPRPAFSVFLASRAMRPAQTWAAGPARAAEPAAAAEAPDEIDRLFGAA